MKIRLKLSDELQKGFANSKSIVHANVMKAISKSALAVLREAKKNVVPGWGAGIQVRNPYFTGRLNRSITVDESKLSLLKAVVGANTIYAAIQEYGGIIHARRAKALFVPTSRLGRKVGPQKGGNKLLKYGRDFIFKQSVEIKPKEYMARGLETAMPDIRNYITAAGLQIVNDVGFK